MKLKDKRLLMCADMCTGDVVCDIGTDHGYLPAFLIKEGKCRRAIAADINKKPLEAAKATFAAAGISDKADFYLSDGLKSVPIDGVTDIVIAGMGGELISSILAADERVKSCGADFILQPMTRASALRHYLAENGFETTAEKAVQDGRFVYTVIKCRYTGKIHEPDIVWDITGMLDPSDDEDRLYISKELERLEKAAEGMKEKDPAKSEKLIAYSEEIRRRKGL